jgi:aspartate aminotransferase-like enzyme
MGCTNEAVILSNGLYGERFHNIAGLLGIRSLMLGHKWGEILDVERLRPVLNHYVDGDFLNFFDIKSKNHLNYMDLQL